MEITAWKLNHHPPPSVLFAGYITFFYTYLVCIEYVSIKEFLKLKPHKIHTDVHTTHIGGESGVIHINVFHLIFCF